MNKRDIHRIVCLIAIVVDLALFNYAYHHSDVQKEENKQVEPVHNTLHSSCDKFGNGDNQFTKEVNFDFLYKNIMASGDDFANKLSKIDKQNANLSILPLKLELVIND
jgi:hypothetical protein